MMRDLELVRRDTAPRWGVRYVNDYGTWVRTFRTRRGAERWMRRRRGMTWRAVK